MVRAGGRPAADDLSHAIAIWNALADPREILDQRDSLHWEPGTIAERLHAAVRGAISGAHRRR